MSRDAGAGSHAREADRHAHDTRADSCAAECPALQTQAARGRLPADRAAPAGARSRLQPRPRDSGRHLRRGQVTAHAVNISTIYRNLELLEELGLSPMPISITAPRPTTRRRRSRTSIWSAAAATRWSPSRPTSWTTSSTRLGNERGFQVDVRHVTFSGSVQGLLVSITGRWPSRSPSVLLAPRRGRRRPAGRGRSPPTTAIRCGSRRCRRAGRPLTSRGHHRVRSGSAELAAHADQPAFVRAFARGGYASPDPFAARTRRAPPRTGRRR